MFRVTSGVGRMPARRPSGSTIHTPPEPVHQTRPAVSTFIPSGTPGASDPISIRMRLPLNVPSAATSKARMRRFGQNSPRSSRSKSAASARLMATYNTDSSGDSASPLVYSHSSVAS